MLFPTILIGSTSKTSTCMMTKQWMHCFAPNMLHNAFDACWAHRSHHEVVRHAGLEESRNGYYQTLPRLRLSGPKVVQLVLRARHNDSIFRTGHQTAFTMTANQWRNQEFEKGGGVVFWSRTPLPANNITQIKLLV